MAVNSALYMMEIGHWNKKAGANTPALARLLGARVSK
jgi:hypothetical protein